MLKLGDIKEGAKPAVNATRDVLLLICRIPPLSIVK
jgi:hypothetical protein